MRVYREHLEARGHQMVKAVHRTTFELTKDSDIGPRGDCIIAVKLDRGLNELGEEFKQALKRDSTLVIIALYTESGVGDIVIARGSKALILSDERRIVVRRSSFIGPETLAINSNKAARDLDRDLVKNLQNPSTKLYVDIYALVLENEIDERVRKLMETRVKVS